MAQVFDPNNITMSTIQTLSNQVGSKVHVALFIFLPSSLLIGAK